MEKVFCISAKAAGVLQGEEDRIFPTLDAKNCVLAWVGSVITGRRVEVFLDCISIGGRYRRISAVDRAVIDAIDDLSDVVDGRRVETFITSDQALRIIRDVMESDDKGGWR